MTTIFEQYVRPKIQIEESINNMISQKLNFPAMTEVVKQLCILAETEAKLSMVNCTTACSNGKTITENLTMQRAYRTAANVADMHGHTTLRDKYNEMAEDLRKIVNNANAKEI